MIEKFEKTQIGSVIPRATLGSPLFVDRNKKLNQRDNVVVVQSMDDFPAAVAGVRTFDTDTLYIIEAALSTSDRFEFATGVSVRFVGNIFSVHGIIYTGSGNAWTGTDFNTIDFDNLFLSTPNGTLLNIQPDTPQSGQLFFVDTGIVDCNALGTIKNLDTFSIEFSALQDIGTGLILDSITAIGINFSQSRDWKNQTTSMFTIQGTNDTIVFNAALTKPKSNETSFDIKSTSTVQTGVINSSPVDLSDGGDVFASGSKDQTDVNWKMEGNFNIPDSTAKASMTNASASVVIVTKDTPVKVDSNFVAGTLERFTESNGTLTYTGLEDTTVTVLVNAGVTSAAGLKDMSMYVAKNGTAIASSKQTASVDNLKPKSITTFVNVDLSTNDNIEMQVEDNTDATDINLINVKYLVNKS